MSGPGVGNKGAILCRALSLLHPIVPGADSDGKKRPMQHIKETTQG